LAQRSGEPTPHRRLRVTLERYLLSGGRDSSHWVKNLQHEPAVTVRMGEGRIRGTGRVLEPGDEDALARRLVLAKYTPTYSGDLTDRGRTSLAVAVDLFPD
jgi:hypothetical protein